MSLKKRGLHRSCLLILVYTVSAFLSFLQLGPDDLVHVEFSEALKKNRTATLPAGDTAQATLPAGDTAQR